MKYALCGPTRAGTFNAGYAPTDAQAVSKKQTFWIAPLDRVVKEVPKHEQPFEKIRRRGQSTV